MAKHSETFIDGLGTVRECIGCGALIAGGPVRCIRCAKEGDPKANWLKVKWWQFVNLKLKPTLRRIAKHSPSRAEREE